MSAPERVASRFLASLREASNLIRVGKADDIVVYADGEDAKDLAKIRLKMLKDDGFHPPELKKLPGGKPGFAGGGTTLWSFKGDEYREVRSPNGKGFHGTDMLVSRGSAKPSEKTAGGAPVPQLLSILRAMHWMYWTAHWQTSGTQFYSDHQLFQRLYEGMVVEIDGLAEKVVEMRGPEAVDPSAQAALMAAFLERWVTTDGGLVFGALKAEQDLQRALGNLLEEPSVSLGLENFLQGVADAHETNLYLLKQRATPATSRMATLL